MRVLFYTATAFFIVLTGVLAFYAFQQRIDVGGAKVVLSIDVSAMPKEAENQSGSAGLYAEEEAKLNGAKPAQIVAGEGEKATGAGSAETAATNQPSPPELNAADFGRIDPPLTQLTSHERPIAKAEPEKVQTEAPAGKTETNVSSNLASVEDAQPAQQTLQPQQTQQAPLANPAVLALVPPLPSRRPVIPPPVRTAAAEGWGTQVAATDAVDPNAKVARVAILIRGLGQDRRDSYEAITKLPSAISLGFVPNGIDAEEMAGKARELGHEVIVQLPLEPSDYPANNPGPDTLLTSAAPAQNVSHMHAVLSRFKGFTGVTNLMGGKLLQSKEALRPIMEDIKARNLIYIGEGNNSHTFVRQLAQELKIRYGNASVIIDTHPTPDAIKAALDRLVVVAQKRGSAIGIGFASAATIEQVQAWAQGLAAQGITLVPAGSLAQTAGAS